MNKNILCLLTAASFAIGCAHREPVKSFTSSDREQRVEAQNKAEEQLRKLQSDTSNVSKKEANQPVVEMFKGQAEACAKVEPHSTAWEMQSCDDLERLKNNQRTANDFDDWFIKQKTNSIPEWIKLQKSNKSFNSSLVPIAHKLLSAHLFAPSVAKFIEEGIVLQCPDNNIFITVHIIDGMNAFGSMVRNTVCVAVSNKEKVAIIVDCDSIYGIKNSIENGDAKSLVSNVRLTCEHPARSLP